MNSFVKSIKFINQHKPNDRKIEIKMSSGSVIKIEPCHESWEQYGGYREELYVTMPIAERHNGWLHGED